MAEAIIEINGVIGADVFSERADDIGNTLIDVKRQFFSYDNPDSITVFINSDGGRVDEGFNIHDFLRAQGLPITTIGSTVYSIATVILMAGDDGKRLMRPNGRFLVHNPMPAFGIQSDAEGYRALAELLEREQDELISFYARKTSLPRAFIAETMNEDRIMSATEALRIGFIDAIQESDQSIQREENIAIQARYIPSHAFQSLKEQLVNKHNSEKMSDERNNILKNLGKGLKALINMSDESTAEVEEKEETQNTDFEKRFQAMEARISQMEAKEKQLTEERDSLKEKSEQLTELVAQKTNELSKKDTEIKSVLAKIDELASMPAVPSGQPNAPIVNSSKKSDYDWVPKELVDGIKLKMGLK